MIRLDPTERFARARLALLLASPLALAALVIVVASLIALTRLDPSAGTATDAGLARVGDDLALVIVTRLGADIASARSMIVGWGLITPTLALAAASLAAWLVSNRVLATIAQARAEVRDADDERRSRLQEIIHELRTPLAVMATNLELVGLDAAAGGQQARYVEASTRAVRRMSRTVDDLEGHGRLTVESVGGWIHLEQIADHLVAESAGHAIGRGVRVRLASELSPVVVEGVDPDALRTVTSNLMSNAIRLAPKGSEVVIDCGRVTGWAWLSVSDQGPGLAPQFHNRAFERGWQGSHDRDRREGSGLGLTIARQLTEAQGGLITVDSEEGGGATFAVWLPTDADSDPRLVVAEDRVHPRGRPWFRDLSIV